MNTLFPRLPMLQSIGRSSGIDMEEPPDDSKSGEDNDTNHQLKSCNYDSLNILISKFENAFTVLIPDGYFCNKFTMKLKNPSLMHCWKGAEAVKHVYQLKQLVILKSRLELQKDLILCLESATKMEELLKKAVLNELDMWDDICHNRIHCPIRTNLVELSNLCDDLRVQINFWSSLWKRLFYSCQLRNIFGEVSNIMREVKIHLDKINLNCFIWLSKLITIGFRVLAHCDLDRIEYESLCNVAKGLEDYNLLVANFKLSVKRFGAISQPISSMKLNKLLKILAHERSKYSAISCKEYLFGSSDFLKEAKNYDFKQFLYHNFNTCTLEAVGGKNSETLKRVDAIYPIPGIKRISDALFSSYPPLMDFIRREKGFIETFLHAVCHVTTLLAIEKQRHSNKLAEETSGKITSYVTSSNTVLTFVESSPTLNSDDASSAKKKCVSWNDSMMATQANSIASQYFADVWQCFVCNFTVFVEGFYWMGARFSEDHMGCLVLSSDVVSHVVSQILHISAHKGLFPAVIHPHLLELSLRYLLLPSRNSWKMKLSSSSLSGSSPKDQQKWFQDVSESLFIFKAVFKSFQGYLEFFGQTSVHKAPLMMSTSFFHAYQSLMTGFLFTSCEHLELCRKNILNSLAQSDLQSFLTCSKCDLKALFSQLEEASQISVKVTGSVEVVFGESNFYKGEASCIILQHLRSVSDEVSSLQDKMKDISNMATMSFKELCSRNAVQFFKGNMPTGKMWKRKEEPTQRQHSEYIEKASDLLLTPVIDASSKLHDTERFQVLSVVTNELCTAWMNNILDKKIKFSYYGACQLEKDVSFIQSIFTTLKRPKLSARLVGVDIFDYIRDVIGLLKQQPNKGSTNPNNSVSDASSKSNSSKSGSKSNSIENSPLTIKTPEVQPQKGASPQSTLIGASNGALLQQKRPSKKNRSSSRSNASRDEKNEKASKPNQDGRPKFGRSAKVSTNSTETPEVQNNYAFIRDEDKSATAPNDLKDISTDAKPSTNHSPGSPNGNGPQTISNNAMMIKELELNVVLNERDPSDNSNERNTSEESADNFVAQVAKATEGNDCDDFEFSDVDSKDQSSLMVSSNQPIARRDEWLALRVRRGNRTWPRLPLCFSGSIDSCGS